MAPKQHIVAAGRPQKGFFASAYEEITRPENATIVRSIVVFGVSPPKCCWLDRVSACLTCFLQAGVAFLHSSLSELLLPP
jgi:hypothetical protein